MTQIIFVLDPQYQSTQTFEDPRPPRELVKQINTGKLTIGQGLINLKNSRLSATLCTPMELVIVTTGTPPVNLMARHYDMLHGMVDGKTAEQIALETGISSRTVYLYISELKERFGVCTREEVIVMAVEKGLV